MHPAISRVAAWSALLALLVPGVAPGELPRVGLITSQTTTLGEPAPRDAELSGEQIEAMVRTAVAAAGGLDTVLSSTASRVVIKVNIGDARPRGSGVVTDVRVVRAVIRLVHESAPGARITIAEGPAGWVPPERDDEVVGQVPDISDGFQVAGYRDLLSDAGLASIDLELLDLNFDDTVECAVPQGGLARDRYSLPTAIVESDVVIDMPVLKVHDWTGMTNAMKNLIGIAPGLVYGWGKMRGYPPGSGNLGIPHSPAVIDETIVDLTTLAGVDFTVVDAIVGMERNKLDRWAGGRPVRLNTILAGADIVAVDAVAARLIGLNPDDLEYLTLAARAGLGEIDASRIEVRGEQPEAVARRFEKPPAEWAERGHYGQGCRVWLVHGPVPVDEASPYGPGARPTPAVDGWSQPVYFHDDMIDLDALLSDPTHCRVGAYTEFTVPAAQDAVLWLGSGEGLRVWLDDELVYTYEGRRRHRLPNDRQPVRLAPGRNRLLVEAVQSRGDFSFSLNICAPEEDARFDGNRVAGLRFLDDTGSTDVAASEKTAFGVEEWVRLHGDDPLAGRQWQAFTMESGLSGNHVRAMAWGPAGQLWVAAHGLCRFDGLSWRTFGEEDGLPKLRIQDPAADADAVWLATDKGLYRFDGTEVQEHMGGWTQCVTVDRQGRVWAGRWEEGASVYDGTTWITYGRDALGDPDVQDIVEARDGAIWIATWGGGVSRFDGRTWRRYTTADGLRDNHVTHLTAGPDGAVWLAMDDNGVSRFADDAWRGYGEDDGLPRNVSCLTFDSGGSVWAAGEGNGVARFDGHAWSMAITSAQVNDISLGPRGGLWFGSDGAGLARLRPGR